MSIVIPQDVDTVQSNLDTHIALTTGFHGVTGTIEVTENKNISSGYVGIGTNLLVANNILTTFNLLKIASTNIFANTTSGMGSVTYNNASGTVTLSCPANNDDAGFLETDMIALSLRPTILVMQVTAITLTSATVGLMFGLAATIIGVIPQNGVIIHTTNSGTNWYFRTSNAGAVTTTEIVAPVANDVYVVYCTSARCSLYRNGVHIVTHTTDIPAAAVGHVAYLECGLLVGAGSQLTLGFMS